MEWKKLISEKLHPLFIEYGFELMEESKNVLKYGLDTLIISLVYNQQEHSKTLWVGRDGFQRVEIDNQVMKEFFNSDLIQEGFVDSLSVFFLNEGHDILKGNVGGVIELEKFNDKRSAIYTARLLEKQSLEAANRAWKAGEYSDVVKYLKMVNEENLSASLKQKYKIALNRLSS